jgi:hypothetical protein
MSELQLISEILPGVMADIEQRMRGPPAAGQDSEGHDMKCNMNEEDKTMLLNEVFPEKWMKSADLKGQEAKLTIANVVMEDLGGERKAVVYFDNVPKGLVLNKTNATTIADAYGENLAAWLGKVVVLYPTRVQFQGRSVEAIRIRVPAPEPVAATPAEPDRSDELPF